MGRRAASGSWPEQEAASRYWIVEPSPYRSMQPMITRRTLGARYARSRERRLRRGAERHPGVEELSALPELRRGVRARSARTSCRGIWAAPAMAPAGGLRRRCNRGYWLSGTSFSDVSRAVGGPYATLADGVWSFVQFGSNILAFNGFDAPQVFDVRATRNSPLSPLAHGTLCLHRRRFRSPAIRAGRGPGAMVSDQQLSGTGSPRSRPRRASRTCQTAAGSRG